MQLGYSGENYLKTILLLHQNQDKVREVDIAARLDFTKASVSRMIKKLAQQGHVTVENGNVCLTREGYEAANRVYGRFLALRQFLTQYLGIMPEIAGLDAGAMEHVISDETFEALIKAMNRNGGKRTDDLIFNKALD